MGSCLLLPLFLKADELVCSLLPLSAELELLSLLAKSYLLLKIGIHALLVFHIEIPLAGIEAVACSTETVIYLLIVLP